MTYSLDFRKKVLSIKESENITFATTASRFSYSTNIGMPIHPHMLRHSTGYKLANDSIDTRTIQHYLGHKNIKHTVRYTELSSRKFDNLWTD